MKLEFSQQQLQILSAALVELPYKMAAPLIAHINLEIQRCHNEAADEQDRMSGATPKPDDHGD